ncbi:hypothetical protein Tco_0647338, partial [Tanacetum coccineum]
WDNGIAVPASVSEMGIETDYSYYPYWRRMHSGGRTRDPSFE